MDESATRRKKIDPKLYEVGWEQVPESEILTEQRAYIAPGQVSALPQNRHPKKVDYILEYRKQKLAVIEAKSDEKHVSEGVEQARSTPSCCTFAIPTPPMATRFGPSTWA